MLKCAIQMTLNNRVVSKLDCILSCYLAFPMFPQKLEWVKGIWHRWQANKWLKDQIFEFDFVEIISQNNKCTILNNVRPVVFSHLMGIWYIMHYAQLNPTSNSLPWFYQHNVAGLLEKDRGLESVYCNFKPLI